MAYRVSAKLCFGNRVKYRGYEVEWDCGCGRGLLGVVVVIGVGLEQYLALFWCSLSCLKRLIVVEESVGFEFVVVDNNGSGLNFSTASSITMLFGRGYW